MPLLRLLVVTVVLAACDSGSSSTPPPPPPPPEPDPRWSTAAPLPVPLQEFHAAVLDGRIYIAGGIGTGNADSDRAYRYDPERNSWDRVADLPERRHHMPLAVANDTLYAIGGFITEGGQFLGRNNLWLYDVENDAWVDRPVLPHARGASAVGVVDGKLIVAGGYGFGTELIAPVAIYDPAVNAWSNGAPIPTPRDHLTAAAVDGIVYAIGGRQISLGDRTGVVEAYDPEADEWTSLGTMPTRRAGLGGVAMDGRIYTYGGEGTTGSADAHHEVYDPAEGAWEILPPLPEGRHGMGVAAVDGRIFVIGGGPQTGFSQSATVQVFTP